MTNRKLLLTTSVLAFIVVILGAYTRLTDAGLGCPDWPGCYGKILAPDKDTLAWTEMIHRYIAGSLGLLILYIALKLRTWPAFLVLGLVFFQGALGMWTVTLLLYPAVVMGHLLGGFAILSLLWYQYLKYDS